MALRPCLEDGCPELVTSGRCDRHQAAHNRLKEDQPHRWVYRDPRWPRCRRRALARAGYRCEVIENGVRCPVRHPRGKGLHGHHHPHSVRELLALGVDPFDERLVKIACDSHHGRIEAEIRAAAER